MRATYRPGPNVGQLRGTGIGFRSELAADLIAERDHVDFVEVVAETCFTQRAARREANAIAEIWPVVPHGVKLSLGSAEGIDRERAHRLGVLARELRAEMVSEHASFTRAGGVDIGHLTQLPRTRAAVAILAANVERARRLLPDVPLILENVAWSLLWPDDEMDEPSFYQEVVRATGCDLLLDVGNLYANAVNEGRDPIRVLDAYPLDRVAMIHVAGGTVEHGFYFDTHAHPVPDAVVDLVRRVVGAYDVPVMIERDANFDAMALWAELAVLRGLPRAAGRAAAAKAPTLARAQRTDDALTVAQSELAARLAGFRDDGGLAIDRVALARARGILHRKRFDDALPLLSHLARDAGRVRVAAQNALAVPRPLERAAPRDAWDIAEAALLDPELADAASLDRLVLRARFTGAERVPRRGPFIGFTRLTNGTRVRATKGLGVLAEVTLHHARQP